MASDDPMAVVLQFQSELQEADDDEDEIDDDRNDEEKLHRQAFHSQYYLSRLSMCTTSNSSNTGSRSPISTVPNLDLLDEDADHGLGGGETESDIGLDMVRLSIEGEGDGSAEEDGDAEFSDGKEGGNKGVPLPLPLPLPLSCICIGRMSSDSHKEKERGCYSLPATPPPPRIMTKGRTTTGCDHPGDISAIGLKEYASENEAQRTTATAAATTTTTRRRRRRRSRRSWFRKTTTTICSSPSSSSSSCTRWGLAEPAMRDRDRAKTWDKKDNDPHKYGNVIKAKAEEEEEEEDEGGSECVVITRPKGGGRSLMYMDLEEVKACQDLGFELDNPVPSSPGRISTTVPAAASTMDLDTSSGGNSPIANWRISSPGDDPRDVKARLKVWAQAVALASTSRHVT